MCSSDLTGLHFEDVRKLLVVLHSLVAQGNTVLVIEHNLDIIKISEWIVDMGPEGGEAGGRIIAQGTVDQVAATKGSYTGDWLRKLRQTEKAFPHARAARPVPANASATAEPKANGVRNATPPEAAAASTKAKAIPDVFKRKPDADDEDGKPSTKKRGRPAKTVRV